MYREERGIPPSVSTAHPTPFDCSLRQSEVRVDLLHSSARRALWLRPDMGRTVCALIARAQGSHDLAPCGSFLVRVFVHASPLAHNVQNACALAVRVRMERSVMPSNSLGGISQISKFAPPALCFRACDNLAPASVRRCRRSLVVRSCGGGRSVDGKYKRLRLLSCFSSCP